MCFADTEERARIAEWHPGGIHDGNLRMAARALRKKLCIVSLVWTTAPKTVARQNLSCCPPSGLPVVHWGTHSMDARARRKKLGMVSLAWTMAPNASARRNFSSSPLI
eukprot:scaffold1302_cov64-Phaeocystis_antarctica.AAC.3